ncbi:MAG: class I lanthipeptide [Flammeovirgaceae bacterium]|nr:class I lanthipeptide [Flammeovirgaceae bacterium]
MNNKLNFKKETLSSLNRNEMIVLKGGETYACWTLPLTDVAVCTNDVGCGATRIGCQ